MDATAKFEVSAQWMKACGKGDGAKVFDVIAVHNYPWAGHGFHVMVDIDDNGRTWTAAICRGRFI